MSNRSEIHVSVRANRFTIFSYYLGDRNRSGILNLLGTKAHERRQGLSKKAGRRLKDCIDTLLFFATWKTVFVKSTKSYFRYKVNFITLTLPSKQVHTDKEIISNCLVPFLHAWRRRRRGLLYIWKAEVQDNGNIHFHITSNAFYHHRKLRAHWNRYVNRLGYVDRAVVDNPNSTDVHSVKNIKNLGAYLSSYYLKKDTYNKVLKRYHKLHGKNLKKQDRAVTVLPRNYFNHVKRQLNCKVWDASSAIKKAKMTYLYDEPGLNVEFERLFDVSVKWDLHFTDHSTTLFNWTGYLNEFQELRKRFFAEFKELMDIEMGNTMRKEEIDSIV